MSEREDGFYWVEYQESYNGGAEYEFSEITIAKWIGGKWWVGGDDYEIEETCRHGYQSRITVLSDRLVAPKRKIKHE